MSREQHEPSGELSKAAILEILKEKIHSITEVLQNNFECPISFQFPIQNPALFNGRIYERAAIQEHIVLHKNDPFNIDAKATKKQITTLQPPLSHFDPTIILKELEEIASNLEVLLDLYEDKVNDLTSSYSYVNAELESQKAELAEHQARIKKYTEAEQEYKMHAIQQEHKIKYIHAEKDRMIEGLINKLNQKRMDQASDDFTAQPPPKKQKSVPQFFPNGCSDPHETPREELERQLEIEKQRAAYFKEQAIQATEAHNMLVKNANQEHYELRDLKKRNGIDVPTEPLSYTPHYGHPRLLRILPFQPPQVPQPTSPLYANPFSFVSHSQLEHDGVCLNCGQTTVDGTPTTSIPTHPPIFEKDLKR